MNRIQVDGAVLMRAGSFLLGSLLSCALLRAQQPITFQYVYDDLNQLTKMIDTTGIVLTYLYDPLGNILQVSRSTVSAGALTIFNITPLSVVTGGTLTIQTDQYNAFGECGDTQRTCTDSRFRNADSITVVATREIPHPGRSLSRWAGLTWPPRRRLPFCPCRRSYR